MPSLNVSCSCVAYVDDKANFQANAGFQECLFVLAEKFPLTPVPGGNTVLGSPPDVQLAVAVQQTGLGLGGGGQHTTSTDSELIHSLVEATTIDIEDHLTRFQMGSRGWVFELYLEWLSRSAVAGDTRERERAFIIYGDAGVGKSTIAAKLACMPPLVTHILAYHFCKHNDNKYVCISTFFFGCLSG